MVNPLYMLLAELDALDAKRSPGPWWQRSWMTDAAPPGAKTELSHMLCFFADEGEPRFWDYINDGMFIVKLENAWPLIREELCKALALPPEQQGRLPSSDESADVSGGDQPNAIPGMRMPLQVVSSASREPSDEQ